MIKIGVTNKLMIKRFTDNGAYLTDGGEQEVLLPNRYLDPDQVVGDEVECFVYTDSEDRPVATTEKPFAQVGQVAFLQVADVSRFGAFLDWGLPKNLLVPFKEQRSRMLKGGIYPVYVYVDNATGRVVASAKLEKFIANLYPNLKIGQVVDCIVVDRNDIGYKVVVDNKFWGIIYSNSLHSPLEIESVVKAKIKKIRDDGKLDLTLGDEIGKRVETLAAIIFEAVQSAPTRRLNLSDSSSPEEIEKAFKCSKKDFKRALSLLYRERKIRISTNSIEA